MERHLFKSSAVRAYSLPTFGDLAVGIPNKLVTMDTNIYTDSIHLVTDRFPAVSIKNAERGMRAAGGMRRIKMCSADRAIPSQWKKKIGDDISKTVTSIELTERQKNIN